MDWNEFKGLAAGWTVHKDALHIYAAILVQIVAAALIRRPLSSWLPWLCVLAVQLLNEALDIAHGNEVTVQEWQLLGARHDTINTMALPTLLLLLCRYAPFLFVAPLAADAPAAVDGEQAQEPAETPDP